MTNLTRRKLVVENQRQQNAWNQEKLDAESIMVAVIGALELFVDKIHRRARSGNEENFHHGVVNRNEADEKIQVARQKDEGEEELALSGNSCTLRTGGGGNANNKPAADLVFHIFASRRRMARTWERSPTSRKMFIFQQSFKFFS